MITHMCDSGASNGVHQEQPVPTPDFSAAEVLFTRGAGEDEVSLRSVAKEVPTSENPDESPPTTCPRQMITQASLKRYLRLKKAQRELQPWIRQVKKALADGVPVEPGPCTVEVRHQRISLMLSKRVIEAIGLTPERLDQLREELGVTEAVTLLIKEYGEAYPFDG